MSVGPFSGIIGSAAGVPAQQSTGNDAERLGEARSQQRKADTDQKAEDAAGIGQTSEDQESSDRDADGRRLWETGAEATDPHNQGEQGPSPKPSPQDPTGQCGGSLDVTG